MQKLFSKSSPPKRISTTSKVFLETVRGYFDEQQELLVDSCFAGAGGSTEYLFFGSFDELFAHVGRFPPSTRVMVSRLPQLPIRGIVDQELIALALSEIPEGTEFLVAELELTVMGKGEWYSNESGQTQGELLEALTDRLGRKVAVGIHPRSQNPDTYITAYVPNSDGQITLGAY